MSACKRARNAQSFGEFSKLPDVKEHTPCPHSNHTSSSLSGNSSERCCPNERQTIRLAVTGCASPTGWSSRSSYKSWCSVAPTRESPTSRARQPPCAVRDEWIEAGAMEVLREMALEAYDKLIGLQLCDVAFDSCITKAPCGGEKAGRSPVDRGKQGIK